jgi:hypothetical protein
VIEPLDVGWSGGSASASAADPMVIPIAGSGPSWTPCEFDPDTGEVIRQCPVTGGSVPPSIAEAKREACERFDAMFSAHPSIVRNVECEDVLPSDAATSFPRYRIRPSEASTSSITVTLYQPLASGAGNVWAVLEVDGDGGPRTGVPAGSNLEVGEEIEFGYLGTGDRVYTGLHVGASDSCDNVTEHRVPDAGSPTVDVTWEPESSCRGYEPGYLYSYIVDGMDGQSFDPMDQGAEGSLASFMAVPVLVHFPEPTVRSPRPTDDQASPPTDEPTWLTSPRDPYGWTVEYPQTWTIGAFDDFNGRYQVTGMYLSSGQVQSVPGVTGEPDATVPAPGEVMVKIWHRSGGPAPVTRHDSSFPLTYDDLRQDGISLGMPFSGDGLGFTIRVSTGDGHAGGGPMPTPEQESILRRIISSIAFEPWEEGETRHGWTSAGRAEDLTRPGGTVLRAPPWPDGSVGVVQEGALIVAVAECEGAAWSFSVEAIVLTCPDGSTTEWQANLEPVTGDAAADLRGYVPAIRSWDGHILVSPER